jgi:hypothetical protein
MMWAWLANTFLGYIVPLFIVYKERFLSTDKHKYINQKHIYVNRKTQLF